MAVTGKRLRLGEILINAGLVTQDQIAIALSKQKQTRAPIGEILVSLGYVNEDQIRDALEIQYGVRSFDPNEQVAPELLKLLPDSLQARHKVVPVGISGLTLAMVDPGNSQAIEDIRLIFKGVPIHPVLIREEDFLRLKQRASVEDEAVYDRSENRDEDPSSGQLATTMLANALQRGASEIVVEPQPTATVIRYRIQGRLQQGLSVPARIGTMLVDRLKAMAQIPLGGNVPQTGMISYTFADKAYRLLLQTLPTAHGLRVTLRIHDCDRLANAALDSLVLEPQSAHNLRELLNRPSGLIVINGSRFAGKTTLLYACIREALAGSRSVVSLEPHLPMELPGACQLVEAGYRLETLEAILSQAPDLAMVSEVSEPEIARRLVRGALAGSLVLMSLPTTQAFLDEVLDLTGLPVRTLANAIAGVVTQRMVRRLCEHCKRAQSTDTTTREIHHVLKDTETLYQAVGCDECQQTGYQGLVGVYEVFPFDGATRQRIIAGDPKDELDSLARSNDVVPLRDYALWLVSQGLTTLQEIRDTELM